MSDFPMPPPASADLPLLTAIIMVAEERRDELCDFLARVGGQIIMLTSASPLAETTLPIQDLRHSPPVEGVASHSAASRLLHGLEIAHDAPHSTSPAWQFLPKRRDLRRPDGRPCGLTTAEYEALFMLHAAAPAEISRGELAERVFGRAHRVGDRAIDTLIYKLREKIGADAIVTLRGRGYAFAEFPEG